MPLSDDQLLSEIEDAIRTMPPRATIQHDTPENHSWFGRVLALVSVWDSVKGITLQVDVSNVFVTHAPTASAGLQKVLITLQKARHDLLLKTDRPLAVAVGKGQVYNYFDELRKVVESATAGIFFVDQFLDAEFVSIYLPQIKAGVATRLLTRRKLTSLLPAVDMFVQQSGQRVSVRSSTEIHGRYVFVDGSACYLSDNSFSHGGKFAPTVLMRLVDSFEEMSQQNEALWTAANVERP